MGVRGNEDGQNRGFVGELRCGGTQEAGRGIGGDTTTPVGDRDAEITCGALKGIEKRA